MSEIPSTPRLAQHKGMPLPRSRVARAGSSLANPLPLSHDSLSNLPPDSPSVLSPAPGMTMKLKVRSTTTPEARSRVLVKPRPGAPLGRPRPLASARDEDNWVSPSDTIVGHQDLLDSMETPTLAPSETVLVSVRVRPHNAAELQRDATSAWNTPSYDDRLIKIAKGRDGGKDDREWRFDRILDPSTDNANAYVTSARAHVRSAMEGYNAVVFAYGQTASGKTFTLTGSPSNPGIIPLAVSDLFAQIRSTPDREFLLRASYLELYNETIIDLLSPDGKELTLSEGRKKGEIVINGLTECAVRTEDEIRKLLRTGEDRRKVGGTDWNQRSSRSHCVFRIVIESRAVQDGTRTPGRDKATRISTLSIIDLAGSEKHTSSKERNAEGKHINQSLLTLKLVISKLADMASKRGQVTHVPYRDSKLTRLLQPSLSGDALISVICTISPSPVNMAESISTLSFAQGLKRVMLSAQRKEVMDPEALIQQYQTEIAELRALLREKDLHPSGKPLKNEKDMEARLNELKSLILTSATMETGANGADSPSARPLSPNKLNHQYIDMNKAEALLREELHEERRQKQVLEQEVAALKAELEVRPKDRDEQCELLQSEVSQLRMIADDYERHLREPSQKLREDVRREFSDEIKKLKHQVESKKIWAENLHNQLHKSNQDIMIIKARAQDSEAKLRAVFEWITTYLTDDSDEPLPMLAPLPTNGVSPNGVNGTSAAIGANESQLQAPQAQAQLSTSANSNGSAASNGSNHSDFGPLPPPQSRNVPSINTFNASRMRRGGADLQTQFQDWYKGSIGHRGPMLQEEAPPLAHVDDDDVF